MLFTEDTPVGVVEPETEVAPAGSSAGSDEDGVRQGDGTDIVGSVIFHRFEAIDRWSWRIWRTESTTKGGATRTEASEPGRSPKAGHGPISEVKAQRCTCVKRRGGGANRTLTLGAKCVCVCGVLATQNTQ